MTNDAALPSMAAGRIVVVVGALLLFAGCEPSLNSSDPYERIRALDTLTNPEALANVAIHDEVWVVRLAAVEKLTDQTPIAKLAIDDENLSVRLAGSPQGSSRGRDRHSTDQEGPVIKLRTY